MPIVSQVEIAPLSELTEDDIASYDAFRTSRGSLDSPYFDGAFLQSVKSLIPNAFLARFKTASCTIGYLPFQKRGNVLQPLGAPLSDYHGAVMEKGYFPNWMLLLDATSAKRFEFSGLVGPGSFGATYTAKPRQISDTSGGFAHWLATQKSANVKFFDNLERCRRNVRRDLGEVQFSWSKIGEAELDWVLNHKIEQYARTGVHNVFQCGWTRDMLLGLAASQERDFGLRIGMLKRGDEILAGNICLMNADTVHFWFPTYDPKYSRYSLGHLLTYDIIEKLSEEGVKTFDFGSGGESYKSAFTKEGPACFEGSIKRVQRTSWPSGQFRHATTNLGRKIQIVRACETDWQGRMRGIFTITKRAIVKVMR